MQPPFSQMGIFLGYCDHSAAIRQTQDGAFSWPRIERARHSIKNRCFKLRPATTADGNYIPKFASCFGHSDDILFMLVDSFSDAAHLTSGIPQLENYTMAHCYNKSLFDAEVQELIADPEDWIPKLEIAQSQPPLKTVSHLKLSGIITLAFGLHAQIAACSLIGNTISKVIKTLKKCSLRSEHQLIFEKPHSGVDLFDTFRFSLLSPVASDDLVIVMHSHSYSLCATALAAIRSLTFSDLCESSKASDNSFFNACQGKEVFHAPPSSPRDCPKRFLELFVQVAKTQGRKPIPMNDLGLPIELSHNHLLAASFTTLAVNQPLSTLGELSQEISGFASVQANADINPGHELDAGVSIKTIWEKHSKDCRSFKQADYRFVLPGKHDLSLYFNENPLKHEQICISLDGFFHFVQGLFSTAGKEDQPLKSKINESGFQDISTNLAIPIPRLGRYRGEDKPATASAPDSASAPDASTSDQINTAADQPLSSSFAELVELLEPPIDPDRHMNAMHALEAVSDAICSEYLLDFPEEFDKILQRLELNDSARAAAHRLYAEFAEAMADPIQMDSVVDLSDAFHALFTLMETKSFSVHNNLTNGELRVRTSVDSQKSRAFFVEAIDGLTQALLLRTGNSSVKREERFGDLQGSITSLLGAGDTAIKSSLGLLRRRLFRNERDFAEYRRNVTGLIVPILRQRPTAKQFVFSNVSLTLIKMDRMHIFNPMHLVRVLHEVSHLYFDKMVRTPFKNLSVNTFTEAELKAEDFILLQASELFAEKITQIFIFGKDVDLYVANQLAEFCLIQNELADDDLVNEHSQELLLVEVQVLYRLFLVTQFNSNPDQPIFNGLPEHGLAFRQFCERWATHFRIATDIPIEEFKELCNVWADSMGQTMLKVMGLLAKEIDQALTILKELERQESVDSIRKKVSDRIDSRLPLPLAGLDQPIDEGLAVFALVYTFIRHSVRADSISPAMHRLENFTVASNVLKSLWHISTRQKRRRFADLLELASR